MTSLAAVAAIVAVLSAAARPAAAQSFYVESSTDQFGILNAATGAYTSIATTPATLFGIGLAADGNVYGLDSAVTDPNLYRVNTTTGALTTVGRVGAFTQTSIDVVSTLGSTSDGTLYAYYGSGPRTSPPSVQPNLYTIDPTTADATLVGPTGVAFDGALSGDGNGNLFGSGGDDGASFLSVNRTTGAVTTTNINAGYGTTYTFAFSSATSSLLAFGSNGGIFTVDPTTGIATSTGQTYNTSVVGTILGAVAVTSSDALPEPGSIVLLALSGLPAVGMILARRRKAA